MDKEVDVILKPLNGNDVPVHSKRSDTVRSLLETAGIAIPPNSKLICISKGNQLQLDLTLGIQGIESNDTIFILWPKMNQRKLKRHKINVNLELYQKMKEFERQQKELFEEALRVFDLSFLLFDYYRSSISAYQSMLNQQELSISQYECNSNEQDETVLETTNSVSSEPLPTCWQQEEDSSSGDEQSIWEECLFAKPNFELDSSN